MKQSIKHVYQINQVKFNSITDNLMLTGGTNGVINFWDIKEKNKIGFINPMSPITSLDIS